jgi:hypothetical protein
MLSGGREHTSFVTVASNLGMDPNTAENWQRGFDLGASFEASGLVPKVIDLSTRNVGKLIESYGVFKKNVGTENLSYNFKSDEDIIHFNKHYDEFINVFGIKNYSLQDYVNDTRLVIQHGIYAPGLNAYVAIAGGRGSAKGIIVGLIKPVFFLEK